MWEKECESALSATNEIPKMDSHFLLGLRDGHPFELQDLTLAIGKV